MTRLPLQLGRASLNQGARFAALVWIGPLLLIVGSSFIGTWGAVPAAFGLGLPAIALIVISVGAAMLASADRASDIVLDESGFVIEGGPLDKMHVKWSEVRGCEIVKGDTRRALRWIVLSWLTARRFASINKRARVPLEQLQLSRKSNEKVVLAEAEGDEIESLAQLRDSIRSAVAPHKEPPPLPQEILKCPHCDAPLVPAATARMACTYCHHDLDVPAELQERVRASIELDQTSGSRARDVRQLVDQPSARHAAFVITWCRRCQVWIQPAAFGLLIALLVHSTGDAGPRAEPFIGRVAPNDNYVFVYDLALFAIIIAAAFVIAWSVGHAYIANRQALRMLADNFGAVPPVKPGAPSTCNNCSAPLPASTMLLVHCAYCAAENVLGVDPRPAAMRRKREHPDLVRGLRRRRRARIQRWVTIPMSALITVALVREVRMAWDVPHQYTNPLGWTPMCDGRCGDVTNTDPIRRTFTIVEDGKHVQTTVLPHGIVTWDCEHECTIERDRVRVTPKPDVKTDVRIEHGVLEQ